MTTAKTCTSDHLFKETNLRDQHVLFFD